MTIPFTFYRFLIIGLTAVAVLAPLSLVFYQSFLTAPFFQQTAQHVQNALAHILQVQLWGSCSQGFPLTTSFA